MHPHALQDNTTRYTLLRPLGLGGMGEVYLALKRCVAGAHALVALKTVRADHRGHAHIARLLAREARLGMAAAGPGVVDHRSAFVALQQPWIELEYLDGEDLARLAARARRAGQRVPPYVAVYLMCEVLDALAHLARVGIIHRDVSPQNVMVAAHPARVKLIDFGIARHMSAAPDELGPRVLGKSGYMAPEQFEGGLVEPSADLFSASVMLWELLVGEPPFGDGTEGELMARAMSGEREAPSLYAPGVPRALDDIVLAGMRARRRDRIPSAAAMRKMLLTVLPRLMPVGTAHDPRAAVERWLGALPREADDAQETRFEEGPARSR